MEEHAQTDTTILEDICQIPEAWSLKQLEFTVIRERLAEKTRFGPSRRLAYRLVPSDDLSEVEKLHDETDEGIKFLDSFGDLDCLDSIDPMPLVEKASLNGLLRGDEILEVLNVIDTLERTRTNFLNRPSYKRLNKIAQDMPSLIELSSSIREAIGLSGEVLDRATPRLGGIRERVRASYLKITETLEKVIETGVIHNALQDDVVSTRGGRLVVHVKSGQQHKIPGVVHDVSNTGATLFIEPFVAVDICNKWRALSLEEDREVRKVLGRLSKLIGVLSGEVDLAVKLTARLDFILARARYSVVTNGVRAGIFEPGESILELLNATHPILLKSPVPISIRIGRDQKVMVITGPNTGGKTVAMKTVGILALMNQSGLQIPAHVGSHLPIFAGVFTDIGDQQNIGLSVSTFSSHVNNLVHIVRQASSKSLVLLDEIGASTDPDEGSALAKAILKYFALNKITTIATTHYRSVAVFAQEFGAMVNSSVDLDLETLMPTYQLVEGIPGRSYGMIVAARLGLDEDIVKDAEQFLSPAHRISERWLSELYESKLKIKQKLKEVEEASWKAQMLTSEREEQITRLEHDRREILIGIRSELLDHVDGVQKKIRKAEGILSWGDTSAPLRQPHLEKVKQAFQEITKEIDALEPSVVQDVGPHTTLSVGDLVLLEHLGVSGTVRSLPDENGELEVVVGSINIRVDAGSARLIDRDEQVQIGEPHGVTSELGPLLDTTELDLRGERVEDALIKLDLFLDKAARDGLDSIRVIHGKGTGALRHAVSELLNSHTLVKGFQLETPERGGNGVTTAELV